MATIVIMPKQGLMMEEGTITQPIAVLGEPGEDISALLGGDTAPAATPVSEEAAPAVERAPGERVFSSPRARLRAEENGVAVAAVPGSGPDGLVIERDVNAYLAGKPAVTPLAANIAKAQGVDLSGVIGLSGIAAKSAELIEKAREGRLTDADYHGGAFTVSSLGMFGLDDFVAIINPPESAILAVGKIAKTRFC